MKVFNGLTNLFKESDDEDDFLDEEYSDIDETGDDGFKTEEKRKPQSSAPSGYETERKSIFAGTPQQPPKHTYTKEKVRYDEYDETEHTYKPHNATNNVVPIGSASSRGMEVVVIHPESMEDANEITDTLLSGRAVVLNLEGINMEVAQRIIDYSAGSCYAMRGNLQKISNYIFIVTPSNVEISGDFQEMINTGIDLGAYSNSNYQF